MSKTDFIVVGSSGGGGTIAWLLAKAGFRVLVLEQGGDFAAQAAEYLPNPAESGPGSRYNAELHDEYRITSERPHVWKRLRGEYNTFRRSECATARPLSGMGGLRVC